MNSPAFDFFRLTERLRPQDKAVAPRLTRGVFRRGPTGEGGVSRAAKGADCKSAGYAFVGSSPTSPTKTFSPQAKYLFSLTFRGFEPAQIAASICVARAGPFRGPCWRRTRSKCHPISAAAMAGFSSAGLCLLICARSCGSLNCFSVWVIRPCQRPGTSRVISFF